MESGKDLNEEKKEDIHCKSSLATNGSLESQLRVRKWISNEEMERGRRDRRTQVEVERHVICSNDDTLFLRLQALGLHAIRPAKEWNGGIIC